MTERIAIDRAPLLTTLSRAEAVLTTLLAGRRLEAADRATCRQVADGLVMLRNEFVRAPVLPAAGARKAAAASKAKTDNRDRRRATVRELVGQGMTVPAIAAKVGVTGWTVRQDAKALGLSLKRGRRADPAVGVRNAAMRAMYEAGTGPSEIARKHGVVPRIVIKWAKREGWKRPPDRQQADGRLRRRRFFDDPAKVAEARRRFEAGEAIAAIAAAMGVCPKPVMLLVEREGWARPPLPRPGRPSKCAVTKAAPKSVKHTGPRRAFDDPARKAQAHELFRAGQPLKAIAHMLKCDPAALRGLIAKEGWQRTSLPRGRWASKDNRARPPRPPRVADAARQTKAARTQRQHQASLRAVTSGRSFEFRQKALADLHSRLNPSPLEAAKTLLRQRGRFVAAAEYCDGAPADAKGKIRVDARWLTPQDVIALAEREARQ